MNEPDVAQNSAGGGVRVEALTKSFGEVHALAGVTFEARPGTVLGLLGPNGAGKTTTVEILATLVQPDSGTATIAGHSVVDEPDAVRERIALTGQFAAVDEVLTGRENLEMFARLRGLGRGEAAARADLLLDQFSLAEAGERRSGTYSGGMRRRLDIAASLVVPPAVLFLDEPTTGLDPRSRAEVWEAVRELRDGGLTVILTTQYLEEADQLADDIVVLNHGRIVASGTPAELKGQLGATSCAVTLVDAAQLPSVAERLQAFGETTVDAETGSVTVANAGADELVSIVTALGEAGVAVADVSLRQPTLDDVFFALTEDSSPIEATDTESVGAS
ncbi:MAG: ATP-binding cassette domain-containing protein [Actinomycetota bacterium]